jgi:hypothetical protein
MRDYLAWRLAFGITTSSTNTVVHPEWDYMLSLEVTGIAPDAPIDRQKCAELHYLVRAARVRGATDHDDLSTRYNSGPFEKRHMAALAHSIWRQTSARLS